MGLSKDEIFEKIAKKELTVDEGMALLKGSSFSEKQEVQSSDSSEVSGGAEGNYIKAVREDIKNIISQISNIDKNNLKVEIGFFEQGMESTHTLELVKIIEQKMNVELYPTLLFEYTTIQELADYLVSEFGNKYPVEFKETEIAPSQVQTSGAATTSDNYIIAVQDDLKQLISNISKIDVNKLQEDKGFFDQGLESTHTLELVKMIEKKMQVELYPTLLFEYTSIKELAEYLESEFGDKYPVDVKTAEAIGESQTKNEPAAVKKSVSVSSSTPKERKVQDDIAIIGLAGKYPMADNVEQFWENLKAGKDCVTEVPKDRWDWKEFYDPDIDKASEGKIYCKEGAFVSDVDKFDPLFFGISPREAELMDPQERWFLQIVWKAIEDAGYVPEALKEKVGVFAGVTTYTYNLFGPRSAESARQSPPALGG